MARRNFVLGLFSFTLIVACNDITVVDAIARDKNIYVTKSDGKFEQITYMGKDEEPLISPDKKVIYFIRHTGNMGEYEYEGAEQLAIMQVEINSLKEVKLTDAIHYEDWKSRSELYEVEGFTLSQDGRYIFFKTQKWTASGILVKLNTKTKEVTEISHGDKFELLKEGKYKDHIIVTRSSIKRNIGRQWSNWLINIEGKDIKEIGDDEAVIDFKTKTN